MNAYDYIDNYDPLSIDARKMLLDNYLKAHKLRKKEREYLVNVYFRYFDLSPDERRHSFDDYYSAFTQDDYERFAVWMQETEISEGLVFPDEEIMWKRFREMEEDGEYTPSRAYDRYYDPEYYRAWINRPKF